MRNDRVWRYAGGLASSGVSVGYTRELGTGVCGEVALSGEPLMIDEVANHPNYIETMTGVRSELCVPVKHGDQILGLINVNRKVKTTESCPDPSGGPATTDNRTLSIPTLVDFGEKGWRPGRRLHSGNRQSDRYAKTSWTWERLCSS